MVSREKTRKVFLELINLQLKPHGKTYDDVVGQHDWYMKFNTTREKEQDFIKEAIPDVNSNFYGMIDQLVTYKSRTFYGTWWSTLSGYVNRMRGYYITKHKLEGYRDGTMQSWYFVPDIRVEEMRSYIPVRKPIYCREFPVSWRDIDQAIDGLTSN